MKILVTGGSGFLGSHVADELTKKGHKVEIYDIKKSRWLKKGQKFTKGNILDYKKLEKFVKKNKIIYNFAAVSDLNDALNKPIATIDNNILGTVKILELSRKYKIKRFVYSSSLYSISTQGGFYRCSKRAAEDYIEEYQKRGKFGGIIDAAKKIGRDVLNQAKVRFPWGRIFGGKVIPPFF